MQVHIDRVSQPWQHAIGRRCAAKLVRPPIMAKHWGQKRKPNLETVGAYVDRTAEDLEDVDAQPEAD